LRFSSPPGVSLIQNPVSRSATSLLTSKTAKDRNAAKATEDLDLMEFKTAKDRSVSKATATAAAAVVEDLILETSTNKTARDHSVVRTIERRERVFR